MSRSSSPTSSHEDDDAAVLALAGGKVTKAPQIDPSDLEIAVALGRVRGQILAAAKRDGIGVRELARRMKISASAVSRQLRSEGDMRFSTAVLFAHALGWRWHFSLSPSDGAPDTNAPAVTTEPEMSDRKMEMPQSFESNCGGSGFLDSEIS
jgi:DNA-binding phage protein